MTDAQLPIDAEPGYFYSFKHLHILPIMKLLKGTKFQLQKFDLNCMLNVYSVFVKDQLSGYAFTSAFEMKNNGVNLLTRMHRYKNPTSCNLLIRNKDLIVYNYPNSGALAVSTKVSPFLHRVLEEQ